MQTSTLSPPSVGYKSLLLTAPIVLLIVFFSCVDGDSFRQLYESSLRQLPLPDEWLIYLSRHYKFGHPFCYAILAAITFLCLLGRNLPTILLVFSLGTALEGVQYFLPTRGASWVDLGYNLAGILAGIAIVWFLKFFWVYGTSRTRQSCCSRSASFF